MTREDDQRAQPTEGMTLPQRYFVSEELFREEQTRIFHSQWYCVGRRQQLKRAGDYFLADVAGESLIITLDENESLRAMFNVCRHRGCRLTTASEGQFSHNRIRCPYHRWTYDCQGELLAAPNMPDDFRAEEWPLQSAAIAEWQGFLFVHLAKLR
ncbi:MAG: Rieske (2Fe-2S) protein, partial [Planctomycetota bacterium]